MAHSILFRNKTIAFHLIGQQSHALNALYDITEYFSNDDITYSITDNKTSFYQQASKANRDAIIHISNITTYETMVELTHKVRSASDGRLEVCNLLVFPKPIIREDIHKKIYLCNHVFLGMYYLDEKYQEKQTYVKYLMEYLRKNTKHL